MFEIESTKAMDAGKLTFTDEGINFVGRVGSDNGVQGKIDKQEFEPNEPNTITATVIGNKKYVFLQEEPYYTSQNINKLTPKITMGKEVIYYLVTWVRKFVEIYNGMQGGYKLSDIREHTLELPILSPEDTEPYWEYMAYFIHNIQQQYADQLEAKSEYELNLMCQILGVTRDELDQRVEFPQPQYTSKFTVGELFDVKSTKKAIHKNTITEFNGKHPYVTRKEGDNGIDSYINADEQYLNPGNTISLAMDTYVLYYQQTPYFTGNKVKVISFDGIDKETALYIITSLNKTLGEMTWGETMNMDKLNKIELELPVIAPNSKQIDWDAIRHVTVGGGGQLSGNSYGDMQQRSCDNQTVDSVNLPQPIYKEFKLKELFTSVKRGTRLVKSDRVSGNTPLITAGETNQGVSQYISNNTELFPANSLTIDMFGNVFYRGFDFFADDNVIVLNDPKLSKEVLLYIQSSLAWLNTNYSYAKQFRLKELDSITLKLPVHTLDDSEPNWGYVEEFIKETELNYLVKKVIQTRITIKQIRQII